MIRTPALADAVSAVLASGQQPPLDPDLFSSNTLFGQPGIYPQGSPMEPASGPAITTSREAEAAIEAVAGDDANRASSRYDDEAVARLAPHPFVRAALVLMTGTVAEPLLDGVAAGSVGRETIGVGPTSSPGRVVGPDVNGEIVVNDRYRSEHPALLMPSIAHTLLWTGPGAGEAEEVFLHALVALLHVQSIVRHAAIAHRGTELARRQNSLSLSLLNSREPDDVAVRLRAPDGSGTIPGGDPGMQTPDFATIPFARGDDPRRPRPDVIDEVLEAVRGDARGAPPSGRYDERLLDSFELDSRWAAERLAASVALGLLDPAAVASIARAADCREADVVADLGLATALACWGR